MVLVRTTPELLSMRGLNWRRSIRRLAHFFKHPAIEE
jgi:hypothetical protein